MSVENDIALPPGFKVKNRYAIINVIGHGGFGITYRAYDTLGRVNVAIKELFPSQIAKRSGNTANVQVMPEDREQFNHCLKRFEDEVQSLIDVSDIPSMLKVKHFFEENSTAYMVMEYLEGMDLNKYYEKNKKNNKLTWHEIEGYMESIINSLLIMHKKGLIHRDISPDNIYITNDGRAVLIDFGSVRSYVYSNRMTTILKRGYAPVEQYRENGVFGPWTDIYALSVTIYRLLSGEMPPESISRLLVDKLIPLEKLVSGLPKGVYTALEGGLKVEYEKRTQSLELFRSQLFDGDVQDKPSADSLPEQSDGHTGRYISFESGYFAGKTLNIGGSSIVFGRTRECTVVFPSNTVGVSKKHCRISIVNGQLCIMDLNSTYGTYVNNYKLQPMQWYRLKQTSKVVIGREAFTVHNN